MIYFFFLFLFLQTIYIYILECVCLYLYTLAIKDCIAPTFTFCSFQLLLQPKGLPIHSFQINTWFYYTLIPPIPYTINIETYKAQILFHYLIFTFFYYLINFCSNPFFFLFFVIYIYLLFFDS